MVALLSDHYCDPLPELAVLVTSVDVPHPSDVQEFAIRPPHSYLSQIELSLIQLLILMTIQGSEHLCL